MKHIKTLVFWKDIPGYEGLYKINQLGQVKSLPRKGTKGGIMAPHERRDGKMRKIRFGILLLAVMTALLTAGCGLNEKSVYTIVIQAGVYWRDLVIMDDAH